MSTDLTRTLADLVQPLAAAPAEQPSLARRKAREIIDANPGTTLIEVVALAYIEGKIEGIREVRDLHREIFARPSEFDCICQRCGRRAGSRMAYAKDAPKHGYFEVVCFHCSAGDEPPRAA